MSKENNIGETIRQHRVLLKLTLQKLATESGVSASHLGRVEKGERSLSVNVLRKIIKPLKFSEDELLALFGYPPLLKSSGRLTPSDVQKAIEEFTKMRNSIDQLLNIFKLKG
ncbi:MAG: hypothetical protein AUJ31_02480 [Parcubacteria group bacterium CG1_02_39_15]|uniref:HTH cro/C1-type domain-containing protein n=1 Tax=Candidatus Nealsonbacteria bacterium CG_4_8_14_3_um_filter_40_11 TaxID=1974690 RepID=A0A2M7IK31_9BACT|nr:MAG: hypothetical protein AUJ31_02480 [Parcubacteria group bacterium CG1_02_39_15]PIW90170.1 MAG: hypothetical protein COZ92_01445 [Candidatus Nealsonbacteria bacterium CG_4_8_14_3_um_filter_40_11]